MLCVVTKGHTYLNKPVDKRSKSTKSEVFLKNFFSKFKDISKYIITPDAFRFPEEIL